MRIKARCFSRAIAISPCLVEQMNGNVLDKVCRG
jgi:hypothetical protein